jgi:hypothetical protein
MAEIEIPFAPEMKEAAKEGRKTKTSRTRVYGKVGYTFRLSDKTFVLTDITKLSLRQVRDEFYKEEGFSSPDGFEAYWNRP